VRERRPSNGLFAVIDKADVPLRQRRLPNDSLAILKRLELFRDEIAGVVVESAYKLVRAGEIVTPISSSQA
jgi:hypothetical protein